MLRVLCSLAHFAAQSGLCLRGLQHIGTQVGAALDQCGIGAAVDGVEQFFGGAQGVGAALGEARGELCGGGVEVSGGRDQVVGDADGVGFLA